MALTRQQKDVFGLAVEVLECNGCKAMDHAAATRVQTTAKPGQRPAVVWAVDYLDCLPKPEDLRALVIRAHVGTGNEPWTRQEIRRCGGAMRGFYRRIHGGGLYFEGLRYLQSLG
jgi:hypothetical protein